LGVREIQPQNHSQSQIEDAAKELAVERLGLGL